MTSPAKATVVLTGPCDRCGQPATWFHHPAEPFPRCACTQPSCRTAEAVEK